jgi:alanyl-tRNA synthetase
VTDAKVVIVTGASPQAIALGLTAPVLLQAASPSIAGRGGGKDEFAQGGGTNVDGLAGAIEAVEALIRERTGA